MPGSLWSFDQPASSRYCCRARCSTCFQRMSYAWHMVCLQSRQFHLSALLSRCALDLLQAQDANPWQDHAATLAAAHVDDGVSLWQVRNPEATLPAGTHTAQHCQQQPQQQHAAAAVASNTAAADSDRARCCVVQGAHQWWQLHQATAPGAGSQAFSRSAACAPSILLCQPASGCCNLTMISL